MVTWSGTWLERLDQNKVKVKLWASKKYVGHAYCKLCDSDIKFDKGGFQSLWQHSGYEKHKGISNAKFGTICVTLFLQPAPLMYHQLRHQGQHRRTMLSQLILL